MLLKGYTTGISFFFKVDDLYESYIEKNQKSPNLLKN
jgi:hypothetical protein